jgi:leader peptidase (prepilin peptidase)/N-methyltransferase
MAWWIGLLVFVFGTILGSFLNVVIVRLPQRQSIISPGSRCPACGSPIRFYDNIPLMSYVILRGRCRSCGSHISVRYPTVEALTGLLLVALVARFGLSPDLLSPLVLVLFLIPILFIDLATQTIPDRLSVTGIVVGFLIALIPGGLSVFASLWALAAGGAIMAVVALLGRVVFRQEAMGWGDVKMAAMVGAFLGFKQLLIALFLSFLRGAVVGVVLTARGSKSMESKIPFGPFIALGTLVTIFYGQSLLNWYLGLMVP